MRNSNGMNRAVMAGAGLLIAAVVVWAASPTSYGTTTTIYNYNGATPYILQSDGSSSASYSSFLLSPRSGTTHYELDAALDHSRSFIVTLAPLDSSSAAAAPFTGPMAVSSATIFSRCFTPSGALQDWTQILPGYPDGNCAMRVEFEYNRVTYGLVSSPVFAGDGTGTATVSCTNTSGGSCVAWTDVPNSAAPNANVAVLVLSDGTIVGHYSLTFNVAVSHP